MPITIEFDQVVKNAAKAIENDHSRLKCIGYISASAIAVSLFMFYIGGNLSLITAYWQHGLEQLTNVSFVVLIASLLLVIGIIGLMVFSGYIFLESLSKYYTRGAIVTFLICGISLLAIPALGIALSLFVRLFFVLLISKLNQL